MKIGFVGIYLNLINPNHEKSQGVIDRWERGEGVCNFSLLTKSII